jgi:hypothetical protein
MGTMLGVPATGRTINVGVGEYFRIDNNMVVGVMDTGALMQQLTEA